MFYSSAVEIGKLEARSMILLFSILLARCLSATTPPTVHVATAVGGIQPGQAAYLNYSDGQALYEEIGISCTLGDPTDLSIDSYEFWMQNETQRSKIVSLSADVPNGPYYLPTFHSGKYWCAVHNGDTITNSEDAIFLSSYPKVTLHQRVDDRYPEDTAIFFCDVSDGLSGFSNIRRVIEYQYKVGTDETPQNLSSTPSQGPGGHWQQLNDTTLIISNLQEWALNVRVLCILKWMVVQGSMSNYYPGGQYHQSQSVAITVPKSITNIPRNKTSPTPTSTDPRPDLHLAVIVVGGIVLLALATCGIVALIVLIKGIVKKKLQRQNRIRSEADAEYGLSQNSS